MFNSKFHLFQVYKWWCQLLEKQLVHWLILPYFCSLQSLFLLSLDWSSMPEHSTRPVMICQIWVSDIQCFKSSPSKNSMANFPLKYLTDFQYPSPDWKLWFSATLNNFFIRMGTRMDKILVDSNCELLDLKQLSPNNCQRNMSGFGQVARLSSLKGLFEKDPWKIVYAILSHFSSYKTFTILCNCWE